MAKNPGSHAQDGSYYVTVTDGNGGASPIYPATSTVLTSGAAGTTGAVVGTLAAASGVTNYISGFDVSAVGGTAAVGPIVVAGLKGGSFTYQMFSGASGANLSIRYNPPIPASATNTAITVTTTADGTASAVNVNTWGFQV